MFYRFIEDLTVKEPDGEPTAVKGAPVTISFASIARVRATNQFTGHDTFTGTNTLDFLNAAASEVIPAFGVFKATHTAVRLQLVKEPPPS
jgi:hypothetical protein